MKTELQIGDSVFNSPMGSGTITDFTEHGYPRVNHVGVGRLVHKTEEGDFLVFDPHHSYRCGKYKMCASEHTDDKTTVSVTNIDEAIKFIKTVGKQPNLFLNRQGLEVSAPEFMFV